MYDNYVPLGVNCEAGFQMRRVLGRDVPGFFTWNITSLKSLNTLLASDFAGLSDPEKLSHSQGDLFHDASHDFFFHGDFSAPDIRADGRFEEKLANLRGKRNHFLDDFRSLRDRGETAFFYKAVEPGDISSRISAVRNSLTKYVPPDQFVLVVVREAGNIALSPDMKNIFYRPVTRFSPDWDAHDGHVSSWDKIFREFPYKGEMRLAGY
jgi:hypothetical protein